MNGGDKYRDVNTMKMLYDGLAKEAHKLKSLKRQIPMAVF
jgi:hypothetical protein